MIHELDNTLEALIGYANDLAFEWGWKRIGEAHQRDELKKLLLVIERAQKLKIKLEQIDKLKTDYDF